MPCFKHLLRILLNNRRIAFDDLLVKGWLDGAPLLAMLFTIDREQSFIRTTFILLWDLAIREVAWVLHQDKAYMLRPEQRDYGHPSQINGCHSAIHALQLLKIS